MKTLRRIVLWLALPALFSFNCQFSIVCAEETIRLIGDAGPETAALKPGGANNLQAIPWDQIGAKAGVGYHGAGVSVTATETGACLHCVFQRLDGEATSKGLWLVSTANNQPGDRFRMVATAAGQQVLSPQGTVTVDGQIVRFARAGLVEEYSVSMDGVQQDFVVTEKPAGDGPLKVQLAVSGARVEPATYGAQLVLEKSGRKIAYSRLHATDANGKELPARIEVRQESDTALAVVVNDAGAVYPVRIDPTFSDANWMSMGCLAGPDRNVYAAVLDGAGNLYIGGEFKVAGAFIANGIAQWNGSSWSPLGSGMNGDVLALALSGTNLYAGGAFTTAGGNVANNIAKWNGRSWSPMGSGMNSNVLALVVSGTNLYAGGNFWVAGGNAANGIAQWNGSGWSPLESGMFGGNSYPPYVSALAVSGSTLYAGGSFTVAGGHAASYVAQWNGSSWAALGLGMNSNVLALAVSGGTLYAAGPFTMAGNNSAFKIAQWNGSSWASLGAGFGYSPADRVYSLGVSGTQLYAGGSFTMAGGVAATNIAQWNGSSWAPLGAGTDGDVYALAVSGTNLYASGSFTMAGGNFVSRVVNWNGSSWAPLGLGMNSSGNVSAVAVLGTNLYAGGFFTTAGGNAANYIAQWNGSSWTPLGAGVNGAVDALAVSGGTLYAGGSFTMAGGNAAVSIAQWNGSSWAPLGAGVSGGVSALAVLGTNLYAGGNFTMTLAGGVPANCIAQWNGSSWAPLGTGMGGTYPHVAALTAAGTNLYAGGIFTTAGGGPANNIAQWNGSTWSALGSGMDDFVDALAVWGSNLYAGGYFWSAGGVPARCIAQWNGSTWSALGSGLGGPYPYVYTLAVSGTHLYVGGGFTTVTNSGNTAVTVNNIAQWNGSSWAPLGSGMNDPVYALAVSGGMLYAGGAFTTAGGKVSGYTAEAALDWPTIQGCSVCNANGNVTLNLSTGTNCQSRLYSATNLNPPVVWQSICTNCNGGTWQFVDTNTAGCKSKYYRVSTP